MKIKTILQIILLVVVLAIAWLVLDLVMLSNADSKPKPVDIRKERKQ